MTVTVSVIYRGQKYDEDRLIFSLLSFWRYTVLMLRLLCVCMYHHRSTRMMDDVRCFKNTGIFFGERLDGDDFLPPPGMNLLLTHTSEIF